MKLNTLFVLLCLSDFCLAQTDTSIVYCAKNGHQITKDSAYSIMKFYMQNNVWHGKEYYLKTAILKSEGDYSDRNVTAPIGSFNNYSENGKLDNVASYNNGKLTEVTYYAKSGQKKSWATFDDKGINQQKGWDESGKEIKHFIILREARFKGGPAGWKKYLEKTLDGSVAYDAGAPPGEYSVEVTFKISPDGNTSNVKATSIPSKCKACAIEAVRVISDSREWEPAIQQNEPVEYLAKQQITFLVTEEKKKN